MSKTWCNTCDEVIGRDLSEAERVAAVNNHAKSEHDVDISVTY